jgi:hypothetical protein
MTEASPLWASGNADGWPVGMTREQILAAVGGHQGGSSQCERLAALSGAEFEAYVERPARTTQSPTGCPTQQHRLQNRIELPILVWPDFEISNCTSGSPLFSVKGGGSGKADAQKRRAAHEAALAFQRRRNGTIVFTRLSICSE